MDASYGIFRFAEVHRSLEKMFRDCCGLRPTYSAHYSSYWLADLLDEEPSLWLEAYLVTVTGYYLKRQREILNILTMLSIIRNS